MRVCSFLCSDSLVYTSFFSFLFYTVFIHVIVHALLQWWMQVPACLRLTVTPLGPVSAPVLITCSHQWEPHIQHTASDARYITMHVNIYVHHIHIIIHICIYTYICTVHMCIYILYVQYIYIYIYMYMLQTDF